MVVIVCDERLRLLAEYDRAVEAYAERASDLKTAAQRSFDDFKAVERNCNSAIARVRDAKLALRTHRESHGC